MKADAQKRFIPIAEFCRRTEWDIKPARLKYWCRFGCHGEPIPFRKIGARYFIDAIRMEIFLNGARRPREGRAADLIARIIAREDAIERNRNK